VRVYAVSQIADDLPPTMLGIWSVRYVEIPGSRPSPGLDRAAAA
jgi:hypothetical protein